MKDSKIPEPKHNSPDSSLGGSAKSVQGLKALAKTGSLYKGNTQCDGPIVQPLNGPDQK